MASHLQAKTPEIPEAVRSQLRLTRTLGQDKMPVIEGLGPQAQLCEGDLVIA